MLITLKSESACALEVARSVSNKTERGDSRECKNAWRFCLDLLDDGWPANLCVANC